MASPQLENGHIKIANELWDALMHYRLAGEQMQVLMVIFRQTYGWNKKDDAISLSQFVEKTGIKKPAVVRALRKLQEKRLIIVNKKVNSVALTYSIHKNFQKWKSLTKKLTHIPKPALLPVCYLCGFTNALEQHHITPTSEGGENTTKNKMNLCPNCHTLVLKGSHTEKELLTKKLTIESVIKKETQINKNVKKSLSKMIPTKDTTKDTITKDTLVSLSDVQQKRFDTVWLSFPKKKAKGQAKKTWKKLNPSKELTEKILYALEVAKESNDWTRKNGQYIPHLSTWINAEGWEDEYQRGAKDPYDW